MWIQYFSTLQKKKFDSFFEAKRSKSQTNTNAKKKLEDFRQSWIIDWLIDWISTEKKLIKKNPKNNSFVLLDKPKNLFSGVLCFCLYNNKNTHRNYYNTHICNKEKIYISTISTYRGLILLFLPYLLEFYRIFFFLKKMEPFFLDREPLLLNTQRDSVKRKKKNSDSGQKCRLFQSSIWWDGKRKKLFIKNIHFCDSTTISMTTIWKNSTR